MGTGIDLHCKVRVESALPMEGRRRQMGRIWKWELQAH